MRPALLCGLLMFVGAGCSKPATGPAPSAVAARANAERTVKDHLRGQTLEQRAAAARDGDDESLKILCLIAKETWLPQDLRQPAEEAIYQGGLALLPRLYTQEYPGPSDPAISRMIEVLVSRLIQPASANRFAQIVELREQIVDADRRSTIPRDPRNWIDIRPPEINQQAVAEARAAREKLKPFLADADPALQLWAALLIGLQRGSLGDRHATLTFTELDLLLKSPEPVVRRVTMQALVNNQQSLVSITDPYRPERRDRVLAGLNDSDRVTRGIAARALGKIVRRYIHEAYARVPEKWFEVRDTYGGKRLAAVLGELLEDSPEKEKLAIVEQLRDLDLYGREAVPGLARTLEATRDAALGIGVCDTFKKIGLPAPGIVECLQQVSQSHPLPAVRERAASVLKELQPD